MSNPVALNRSADRAEGLHVSLLGWPELAWNGLGFSLARRASRALLYRLATHAESVPRDELAFLFWPESPESAARRSLTFLLSNLRRALPSTQVLLTRDDTVALNWSVCRSDTVSFLHLVAASPNEAPRTAREQAVQLVRGEFLAGFSLPGHAEFEAWAASERSALERLYLEALAALVQNGLTTGEFGAGIRYARLYLATDDLAEEMYRCLIALYALNGERTMALREFERCAIVLERELHLDPSPETRALYQAVLASRPPSDLFALVDIQPTVSAISAVGTRPLHNLPAPLTGFVGRQSELTYLRQQLNPRGGQSRLITLTGAAGSGKTRLALEVARGSLDQFADGIWWVDLAPLTDPSLVPQAVASLLAVKEQSDRSLVETLQQQLRARHLLLVLDNCEHLLHACGQLAESLLTACPHVVVLATSREAPLGVLGETDYRVPGLSLPDPAAPLSRATFESSEAVQLFLARASAVRHDFALREQNAEAIGHICMGLDGLPLAIELAAAHLNAFTAQDLAAGLVERVPWLSGNRWSPLPRHQTLRAAVDWSYQLLSEAERLLLGRLSVFAGGFSREAAEAVCPGVGIAEADVASLLTRLVDKSLVAMESAEEHARYRLLETIRQFAWEHLRETAEVQEVQHRHARYFAASSEEISLLTEAQYRQLRRESGNLRAALNWVTAAVQTDASAVDYGKLLLQLGAAFAAYCWHYGWMLEGREWASRVLELAPPAQRVPARAWLLWRAGSLFLGADFARSRACLEESIAIAREWNDQRGLALALSVLSYVVRYERGPLAASPLVDEALRVARQVGDKPLLLAVLEQLGLTLHTSADDPRCGAIWEEYLALARELKDESSLALGLVWAGAAVHYVEGKYRLARARLEEGLAILDRLTAREYIVAARFHLALVLLQLGELQHGRAVAFSAVTLGREMGERRFLAQALMFLSLIAHTQGDVATAIPWAEEALSLGREVAARGDMLVLAWTLIAHGRVLSAVDPVQARGSLMESLALQRAHSMAPEVAWVQYYLAWLAVRQQDPEALTFAQEALAIAQERNIPHAEGWARLVQAEWARQCGEGEQAGRLYEQAEQVFRALDANCDLGILLHKQGCLAAQADPGRAAGLWAQSLALARHGGSWAVISANLRSLAGLALELRRAEWAAQLIGAADALKVELVWSLRGEAERFEQNQQTICRLLGERAFATCTAQGRAMQPEQVDALAERIARLAPHLSPASPGPAGPGLRPLSPLSQREMEVLRLAAQPLSDAEIGERLLISRRTVTTHLTSIYHKLSVGSRIEARHAAARLALLDAGAST